MTDFVDMSFDSLPAHTQTPVRTVKREFEKTDVGYETRARVRAPHASTGTEVSRSEYATNLISVIQQTIEAAGLPWHVPSASESMSEVCFEWWNGSKSLTVFVRGFQAEIIKSWGPNIEEDMEDVSAREPGPIVSAWEWLLAG